MRKPSQLDAQAACCCSSRASLSSGGSDSLCVSVARRDLLGLLDEIRVCGLPGEPPIPIYSRAFQRLAWLMERGQWRPRCAACAWRGSCRERASGKGETRRTANLASSS